MRDGPGRGAAGKNGQVDRGRGAAGKNGQVDRMRAGPGQAMEEA
jgi:hypothetical protein